MTRNSYTDDERRQVRSLRANPTRIAHGAPALDPSVLHGRNAAARHDADDPLTYGPSEEETRAEQQRNDDQEDIVRHVIMDAVEAAAHPEDDFLTTPSSRNKMIDTGAIVYDPDDQSPMYVDEGLSCSRIPTTGSVAKATDTVRADTPILAPDINYAKRSFADVAAGTHANPLAAIETHRPNTAPNYVSTTVGTDFSDPTQKSFSDLAGLNGAPIEPPPISIDPKKPAKNDPIFQLAM